MIEQGESAGIVTGHNAPSMLFTSLILYIDAVAKGMLRLADGLYKR